MRYAWAFLAAVLFLIEPRVAAAQLTTLRVGTNSPASTEAVLFSIVKDASARPARAEVRRLERDELEGELVRMLGADDADLGARRHARELLAAA